MALVVVVVLVVVVDATEREPEIDDCKCGFGFDSGKIHATYNRSKRVKTQLALKMLAGFPVSARYPPHKVPKVKDKPKVAKASP